MLLGRVAVLASFVAAWRAARVEPLTALAHPLGLDADRQLARTSLERRPGLWVVSRDVVYESWFS
jgi:hypothetical protein